MKIMLKLQFLTCKKYSEQRSTLKNCNFSKIKFFQCTSTVIPLHIFAVLCNAVLSQVPKLWQPSVTSVSQHFSVGFFLENLFVKIQKWSNKEFGSIVDPDSQQASQQLTYLLTLFLHNGGKKVMFKVFFLIF